MFSAFPRTSPKRAVLSLLVVLAPTFIAAVQATELSAPNCTLDTPGQCLDGVSSGVTGGDSLRSVVGQVSPSSRKDEDDPQRQALRQTLYWGKAAGEIVSGWGVWASGGYTSFEGDPVFGTAITRFDGDLYNGLVGADMTIGDRIVLGAALGYENSDTDTAFNGGTIEVDGFTVAPYALFIVNEYVSVDIAAGFSSLDSQQIRLDRLDSVPGTPVFVRGAFDSERWFASANVNAEPRTSANNYRDSGAGCWASRTSRSSVPG